MCSQTYQTTKASISLRLVPRLRDMAFKLDAASEKILSTANFINFNSTFMALPFLACRNGKEITCKRN